MLPKLKHLSLELTVKFLSIYFAISIRNYVMHVLLGVNYVSTNRVFIIQRNALSITCFSKFNEHTTQLFHKMKITKFIDLVPVENFIFINKYFFS